MKKIELKVEGMHCDSCKALIEDELSEMDGIKSYKAEMGKVTAEFDDKKTSDAAIKKAITSLGYKVN